MSLHNTTSDECDECVCVCEPQSRDTHHLGVQLSKIDNLFHFSDYYYFYCVCMRAWWRWRRQHANGRPDWSTLGRIFSFIYSVKKKKEKKLERAVCLWFCLCQFVSFTLSNRMITFNSIFYRFDYWPLNVRYNLFVFSSIDESNYKEIIQNDEEEEEGTEEAMAAIKTSLYLE